MVGKMPAIVQYIRASLGPNGRTLYEKSCWAGKSHVSHWVIAVEMTMHFVYLTTARVRMLLSSS